MKKQTKLRGFTIVELLIVIVIIAILAAITLVAYNGITDRARDTSAQETANQLRTKIEAYNSVKGAYPANLEALKDEKESTLDSGVAAKVGNSTDSITVTGKVATWAACPATGDKTGGTITYYKKSGNQTYTLGNC